MRLKEYELTAIREAFCKYFGADDQLYLFGSRADDRKKGGDIDLYVETEETDLNKLLTQKNRFLIEVEQQIGEQKIDVVLHRLKEAEKLPIYKIAREEGVKLTVNPYEKVTLIIELCERHAANLKWAIQKIEKYLPLESAKIAELSMEEMAPFEIFMSRFSKLQDAMGAKLFPALLDLSEEPGEYPTFIDKVHRLQKIGAVPEALDWHRLRQSRNYFAHDYPEEAQSSIDMFNKALGQSTILFAALDQAKAFVGKIKQ